MRQRFLSRCAKAVGDWWPVVALIVGLGFILWGVVAHAEEPPAEAEPRVMSERCEAWIAWLVDGKVMIAVNPLRTRRREWGGSPQHRQGLPRPRA